VPKHPRNRSIGAHQIEPSPVGADPQVAVSILGNRTDAGGTDRPGAEGQLTHQTRQRVENIDTTAVSADPQLSGARLENCHDARRAQAAGISRPDRYRLQPAIRTELLHSIRHRPDPQVSPTILQ
jgi:hypothetical protein